MSLACLAWEDERAVLPELQSDKASAAHADHLSGHPQALETSAQPREVAIKATAQRELQGAISWPDKLHDLLPGHGGAMQEQGA